MPKNLLPKTESENQGTNRNLIFFCKMNGEASNAAANVTVPLGEDGKPLSKNALKNMAKMEKFKAKQEKLQQQAPKKADASNNADKKKAAPVVKPKEAFVNTTKPGEKKGAFYDAFSSQSTRHQIYRRRWLMLTILRLSKLLGTIGGNNAVSLSLKWMRMVNPRPRERMSFPFHRPMSLGRCIWVMP